MRKVIVVVTAVIAVLASATASYVVMRNARGGDPAQQVAAQPGVATPSPSPAPAGTTPSGLPLNPDTSRLGWYEPYIAEERRPAYDQVINGITVGPTALPRTGGPCTPGSAEPVAVSATAGTPVQIAPKYLPPFALQGPTKAVRCNGVIAAAEAEYSIPSDQPAGRRGGFFFVVRRRGDPLAPINIPAERWSAATVAGHPAAIARPVLPMGFGASAAVVYAGGVLTIVQARGITLDDLLRIAEGLYY